MHFSVTFIIPVFNTAQYLPDLFVSTLEQQDYIFQCIFINDGSTDNSLKALQNFSQQHTNITVLTQKNIGASSARNLGIDFLSKQQQKPDYVFFLDSEIFYPQIFQKPFHRHSKTTKLFLFPIQLQLTTKNFLLK